MMSLWVNEWMLQEYFKMETSLMLGIFQMSKNHCTDNSHCYFNVGICVDICSVRLRKSRRNFFPWTYYMNSNFHFCRLFPECICFFVIDNTNIHWKHKGNLIHNIIIIICKRVCLEFYIRQCFNMMINIM